MRWMLFSMMIEINTRKAQTTATAHVGVSSRVLPPVATAITLQQHLVYILFAASVNYVEYIACSSINLGISQGEMYVWRQMQVAVCWSFCV